VKWRIKLLKLTRASLKRCSNSTKNCR